MHALRCHQHHRLVRRPECRVVAVYLISGRSAQGQTVVADDISIADAVEYPVVSGLEAHRSPPVSRRPVVGIRLGAKAHANECVRRPVPVAPQSALLAGGLMPELAGQ